MNKNKEKNEQIEKMRDNLFEWIRWRVESCLFQRKRKKQIWVCHFSLSKHELIRWVDIRSKLVRNFQQRICFCLKNRKVFDKKIKKWLILFQIKFEQIWMLMFNSNNNEIFDWTKQQNDEIVDFENKDYLKNWYYCDKE